jgi:hypothetical protein
VHGQPGRGTHYVYGIQYVSLLCSSCVLCNLYVLAMGECSMGISTGLNFQYQLKNLYPWSRYGSLLSTGAVIINTDDPYEESIILFHHTIPRMTG